MFPQVRENPGQQKPVSLHVLRSAKNTLISLGTWYNVVFLPTSFSISVSLLLISEVWVIEDWGKTYYKSRQVSLLQIESLSEIGPTWSQIVAVITNRCNYYKLALNKPIISAVDLLLISVDPGKRKYSPWQGLQALD